MASQALMGQSGPSFDAKKIFPTPNFVDKIVIEVLSRKLPDYSEVAYGTAHPDTTNFPGHSLVLQVEQTEEQVVRYYAADRSGQDAYNYGISYAEESNAHPTYTRDYVVARAAYSVIAKLTSDPIHASALLVKEDLQEKTGDERIDSLYVLVRRVYETLNGPVLTGHQRTPEIRGRTVDVTIQEGVTNTLPVEIGDLILSSVVDPLSTVKDRRTTKKVASLPTTEVSSFWDFVPLPFLLFDIDIAYFCSGTAYFKAVVNPLTGAGSSVIRKHRKTVSYSTTLPNPNLSGSAWTTADIRYEGSVIKFSYQNVLNDAVSYSQEFFNSDATDACAWTEAFAFSATSPSATAFLAGAWFTKSLISEPWGDSGWKTTQIEFYSATGNPSI